MTQWFAIFIPEGSNHNEDINELLQLVIRENGHYDKVNDKDYIEVSANTNTLKSEMSFKNNYEVDFIQDNSINSLLGFHS